MPILKKSGFVIVSLSRLDFSRWSKWPFYIFCKIDSDTVISTEWRNLVFLFLFFSFVLNLVKYAMHFTGQVKKKEKSRTNDASTHETVNT